MASDDLIQQDENVLPHRRSGESNVMMWLKKFGAHNTNLNNSFTEMTTFLINTSKSIKEVSEELLAHGERVQGSSEEKKVELAQTIELLQNLNIDSVIDDTLPEINEAKEDPVVEPELPDNIKRVDKTVFIGLNQTPIPEAVFNKIPWNRYKAATRALLTSVFSRHKLATQSLSGKKSPAFKKQYQKGQLDKSIIEDIIDVVTNRCKVNENEVRLAITTKCADEGKRRRKLLAKVAQEVDNPVDNSEQPNEEPTRRSSRTLKKIVEEVIVSDEDQSSDSGISIPSSSNDEPAQDTSRIDETDSDPLLNAASPSDDSSSNDGLADNSLQPCAKKIKLDESKTTETSGLNLENVADSFSDDVPEEAGPAMVEKEVAALEQQHRTEIEADTNEESANQDYSMEEFEILYVAPNEEIIPESTNMLVEENLEPVEERYHPITTTSFNFEQFEPVNQGGPSNGVPMMGPSTSAIIYPEPQMVQHYELINYDNVQHTIPTEQIYEPSGNFPDEPEDLSMKKKPVNVVAKSEDCAEVTPLKKRLLRF